MINVTNKALMEFVELYAPTAKVRMVRGKGSKVMRIPKKDYEPIAEVIIATLKKYKEISLNKLIDIGLRRFPDRQSGQLTWLIIQIKNDLEFRELIDVYIDPSRNQYIRLNDAI